MHTYEVSRASGFQFSHSRSEAGATAIQWARDGHANVEDWSPWWMDADRRAVRLAVRAADTLSALEGWIEQLNGRYQPAPPRGPRGGLPLPLLRAA